MGWDGLHWIELGWNGLGWAGLGWVGMGQDGTGQFRTCFQFFMSGTYLGHFLFKL